MSDGLREEFRALNDLCTKLHNKQINMEIPGSGELIKILNLIKVCDFYAKTNLEKNIVVKAVSIWKIGFSLWSKHKPITDTAVIENFDLRPAKYSKLQSIDFVTVAKSPNSSARKWELTPDDKRFLRAMRISSEVSDDDNVKHNNDREDDDDGA